ncbi:MAG: NADH-quinone oxidoreductase subunit [Acidimicrobiaceae bacterium]|jgi:NADH-quinone oxidoreductase subunit C|nr:NADH-quinone oxidoreductase subunit [Acidimicrobiaceae bacterium]
MSDSTVEQTETAAEPEPETAAATSGQHVVHATRESYLGVVKGLQDEGYDMLVDLCAVDYLSHPGRVVPDGVEPERFEVVVNLLSRPLRKRVRVRVQVPDADPTLPSLFDLWPGTEAMEREAFDLMGIVFTDHPDLTRILMPEDWEGHPLRKDYGVGRVPVQFKAAPSTR